MNYDPPTLPPFRFPERYEWPDPEPPHWTEYKERIRKLFAPKLKGEMTEKRLRKIALRFFNFSNAYFNYILGICENMTKEEFNEFVEELKRENDK